ncbi:MAG TPA: SpoIIE family protein phosphatase [Candidatus Paceibacterota bacterium]|nr:SpoIIE family protein phosphatase [Candidatus Paceibacterota bacterium]
MSKAILRVLVIETGSKSSELSRAEGFEVEQTADLTTALDLMAKHHFDAAILDLGSSGGSLEPFVKAHTAAPQVPFIVSIDGAHEKLGPEALHLGAQDYLIHEVVTASALGLAVRKAVQRHHAQDGSRRDRHLLEILMDKIPDAIYFKDTESRFLKISRAHAKIFHLANPALAVGKSDADFFAGTHAHQALEDEQRVMRTGQPLVNIEEMETWPDGSTTWVSTTKMPLRDPSGKVIGTFGISRDITLRKKAELALAERTHQLQQKNEQIAEELKMARELQLAMLPQKFPCIPPYLSYQESALEFFSFYLPNGSVSGDFYDVVELSDSTVGIFICDVMGHDVRAALITAMMRSLVQDLSHAAADPGQLLAQINHALAGVFKLSGATMFATALYLVADVEKGELRYASAAHPDALHVRRSLGTVELLSGPSEAKGPALGLFDNAAFPTCRRPLAVDDLLLLFTDGLIEAEGTNHEYFSEERLLESVRKRVNLTTPNLFKELIAEIQQFCGRPEFIDDVSVVGVGIRRLGPPPHGSCPVS